MNHRRRARRALLFLILIAVLSLGATAQQKLMIVGGGKRPPEALARFVEWAGGAARARVLIVTWASGEPAESFAAIEKDFAAHKVAALENAPYAPLTAETRARFLARLGASTAVFFTGGDQNRIMEVLKDEAVLAALRAKYETGAPFGGTSAGAAVMSDPMMTGEADLSVIDGGKVGVRPGLGLLPRTMIDQHFIRRQRQNRLFGFVLANPSMLGVGVDEDTALLVRDNRRAEVAGASGVMIVDAAGRNGALLVYLLKAGEKFDLKKRKRD